MTVKKKALNRGLLDKDTAFLAQLPQTETFTPPEAAEIWGVTPQHASYTLRMLSYSGMVENTGTTRKPVWKVCHE